MIALRLWTPPPLEGEPSIHEITQRQADVLTGLHMGLTNFQIGRRFHMAEDTVKTHAKRLYRVLDARDRCHVVSLTASGHVSVYVKDTQ